MTSQPGLLGQIKEPQEGVWKRQGVNEVPAIPELLQSSLTTPWCSAPSAAPTQCAAQHPHTFLPSKYKPIPIHPSLSLCPRPSPLHPSRYTCYGHFKIRLLMWVFFFLLPGIAHLFRIRSRLSKYHSSLSVPKCSWLLLGTLCDHSLPRPMPLDELVQLCLVVSSIPAPLGTRLTLPDLGEQSYV